MDSFTHIALGACMGEALAGKKLGKKAMLLGAIAQTIPDIDMLGSLWLGTTDDLIFHRGITHSFLFTGLVSVLLSWFSVKIFRKQDLGFGGWLLFWAAGLLCHIFLDAFTVYGTGWLEPFSNTRITFNSLFVLDPLFSLGAAVSFLALLFTRYGNPWRSKWLKIALATTSCYLFLSLVFKAIATSGVKNSLEEQHIKYKRFFTTPTPLNTLLWYAVAESDSGFYAGYRSVFDGGGVQFHYIAKNSTLALQQDNHHDEDNMHTFSNGYCTYSQKGDTIFMNDLRFGEQQGWVNTHPEPVFYYDLTHPDNNKLIVQRGRFKNWEAEAVKVFVRRMFVKYTIE